MHKVAAYITEILRVFGIAEEDQIGLGRERGAAAAAVAGEGAEPLLGVIADFRIAVRNAAKLALSNADQSLAGHKSNLSVCDR